MRENRLIESDFSYMDGLVNNTMQKIFNGADMNTMSDLEKRKRIYDFLVKNNNYDFNLLNDILASNPRYPAEEIYSILEGIENTGRGEGVCNAFSYVYKLLLEKCNIPSMLIIGKLKERDVSGLVQAGIKQENIKRDSSGNYLIDHMFILVQNEDGSFSFDDPTCAILNKDKGINFFNYDKLGCMYRNQVDMKGFPTDYFECIIGRNNQTEADKEMSRKYDKGDPNGFLNLPDNIAIYNDRKDNRDEHEIE